MHAHARRWHTSCDKTATSHSFYRHTIIKSRGRHYHATIRLHGCSFFFRRRVCSQWSRSSLTSFKTWLSNKKMKRATRWTMVDVGCLIPQMRSPISDVTNTMVAQNALLLILYVNITSWGPHYFELVRTHFRDFLSQKKKKKKKKKISTWTYLSLSLLSCSRFYRRRRRRIEKKLYRRMHMHACVHYASGRCCRCCCCCCFGLLSTLRHTGFMGPRDKRDILRATISWAFPPTSIMLYML